MKTGVLHLSKADALRKTQPVPIWGDYQTLPDSAHQWRWSPPVAGAAPLVVATRATSAEWHPSHIKVSVAGATAQL